MDDLKLLNALFQDPLISRVAHHLNYTQSNISKILKRIEDELGFPLFERKGFHGLQPTVRGRVFAERIRKLSNSWEDTLALVKNFNIQKVDIKITGPSLYMKNIFFPKWFTSDLPQNYRLTYLHSRIDQIPSVAESGDLDLLISHKPLKLNEWTPVHIHTEKFAIFHSLRNPPPSLEESLPEDAEWIGFRPSSPFFHEFQIHRQIPADRILAYIDDIGTILEIVRSRKNTMALLPVHASLADPTIKFQIVSRPLPQKLFLMYQKSNSLVCSLSKDLRRILGS